MRKVLNKRNAVIGWLTWRFGKRFAKRKAKQAVPAVEGGRPNKPAIVAGIGGALTGLLFFWRRRRKAGGGEESAT